MLGATCWQNGRLAQQQRPRVVQQLQQQHLRQGQRRQRHHVTAKMYVPLEGSSPERRAAQSLRTFFTFVATRIVMSQLEGIGRGDLGSYNAGQLKDLRQALEEPIRDGDAWLGQLIHRNQMLGVRIMEVREAYCADGDEFEWHQLKHICVEDTKAANVRLLRQHAGTAFAQLLDGGADNEAD